MRETRLSGSEGGVAHCAIPTPIGGCAKMRPGHMKIECFSLTVRFFLRFYVLLKFDGVYPIEPGRITQTICTGFDICSLHRTGRLLYT
jgi:hypothetical protein